MSDGNDTINYEDILTKREIEEAAGKSLSEVLEEAILDLIAMGYENGMTADDVDNVVQKIVNGRAQQNRSTFKLV